MANSVSPSGEQLHIAAGDTHAVVVTLGAGLRSLQHGGRNLLHGFDDATAVPFSRGQVLAPWPNRVADGRYGWDGQVVRPNQASVRARPTTGSIGCRWPASAAGDACRQK